MMNSSRSPPDPTQHHNDEFGFPAPPSQSSSPSEAPEQILPPVLTKQSGIIYDYPLSTPNFGHQPGQATIPNSGTLMELFLNNVANTNNLQASPSSSSTRLSANERTAARIHHESLSSRAYVCESAVTLYEFISQDQASVLLQNRETRLESYELPTTAPAAWSERARGILVLHTLMDTRFSQSAGPERAYMLVFDRATTRALYRRLFEPYDLVCYRTEGDFILVRFLSTPFAAASSQTNLDKSAKRLTRVTAEYLVEANTSENLYGAYTSEASQPLSISQCRANQTIALHVPDPTAAKLLHRELLALVEQLGAAHRRDPAEVQRLLLTEVQQRRCKVRALDKTQISNPSSFLHMMHLQSDSMSSASTPVTSYQAKSQNEKLLSKCKF